MSVVAKVNFSNYRESVAKALDLIGADEKLPKSNLIIIKPNLTNDDRPPVTTNVKAAEAVYHYCTSHTDTKVVIGEGCGCGTTGEKIRGSDGD